MEKIKKCTCELCYCEFESNTDDNICDKCFHDLGLEIEDNGELDD